MDGIRILRKTNKEKVVTKDEKTIKQQLINAVCGEIVFGDTLNGAEPETMRAVLLSICRDNFHLTKELNEKKKSLENEQKERQLLEYHLSNASSKIKRKDNQIKKLKSMIKTGN